MMSPSFDVTTAVAVLNQTLEYAYPTMTIVGEVSDLRVSKGKWVYFDIKDAESKLKCFGTVYQLKTVFEDGMQVEIVSQPRLHNQYGFSLNVVSIRPVGEGSLKKAKDLLYAQLEKEGLFANERKRLLPYPPERIALVTSGQSAAYADFVKIVSARWPLLDIVLYDVAVQGAQAEEEILLAIKHVNELATAVDVVIVIRGGGSMDDLAVFSTEPLTRAIAASRIPTVVAIGHEVDTSLAELAADLRASTPSNAAELLVPDSAEILRQLAQAGSFLDAIAVETLTRQIEGLHGIQDRIDQAAERFILERQQFLAHASLRLESYHPRQVLKRGYGLVRVDGMLVTSKTSLTEGVQVEVELEQQVLEASIINVKRKDSKK